jgi:Flp pilus assembly protein TadG
MTTAIDQALPRRSAGRPEMLRRLLSRSLSTVLRRLFRSSRGSVSIEVVIIVPLMALVMLGFSEIYMYMRTVSAIEHTAFTLADSIGQMPQVINDNSTSDADNLGSIWSAATLLAAPNNLQGAGGVIVTSVCDSTTTPCGKAAPTQQSMAAGTPEIYWQAKAPWTASGMTSKVTSSSILPSTWPFRNGDSAIVVEIFLTFNPFTASKGLWPDAPGTQTIYERVYVRPRFAQALALVAAQ